MAAEKNTCHQTFQLDDITLDEDKRICRMRCSENMACRFYHYSVTKTCILYTSCEQLSTTRELGTTLSIENEGILSFIFSKCN